MKVKSLGLWLAAASLIPLNTGCVSMLAKMALGLATSKTNDLSVCALQSRYVTNLFPKDAHTFDMAYYTSNWTEGANIVMVSCTARNGASLYEIEGTVQVDGEPMEYVAGGTYSKLLKAGDTKPKTISITTTTGQKTSFTVSPAQPVELVAVNGKKGGANVDVTQDLTLEFANVPADNAYVRVGLISDTKGMRNFSDIGVYKVDKKVKIPAVAFRNAALFITVGGGRKSVSLSTSTKLVDGANYLFVERYVATPIKAEGAAAVENLGLAWSWQSVNVKGSVDSIPGVEVRKTFGAKPNEVDFYALKPASAVGRPFAKAKKFALVAMTIDGSLENIKDATKYDMGTGAVSTNASGNAQRIFHAWKFPSLPTSHWDAQLEQFYGEFTAAFQSEFGITFIPVEDVLKAPSYQEMAAADDVNDGKRLSRSFRGLKQFAGPRLGTATVLSDRREVQLMRELGVDGLVVVNLGVDLPDEGMTREKCEGVVNMGENNSITTDFHCQLGKAFVNTSASYRIIGMPKAYGPGLSTFGTGELALTKGVPYEMDEFKDAAALSRVVRTGEMVKAIKAGLKEQETKAREAGYEAVWTTAPLTNNLGT